MSDQRWGVDVFYWVNGDPSMVRWARATGQITEMVQPQIQDIPDVYDNDLWWCAFGIQGVWYITRGDDGADPGIVYFAPYSTGVFSEIARIPDISGDGYFAYIGFPGGLVVTQPGSRHVYTLTQAGVLHHHELPDGFIGDTYDYHQLSLHDVVFNPADRNIALVFRLDSQETYTETAVGLTRLFTPGQPISWVDDLYVVEDPEWGYPEGHIPALLGMVYGGGVLFASGEPGGDNDAAEYDLLSPSAEINAGLGILARGTFVAPYGTRFWPPSGVVATRLRGEARPNRDMPLDPESIPIPRTIPFELNLRIVPPIPNLSAAKMTIDGVPYELDYISHQSWGTQNTQASTSLRAPAPVFAAGESYNIDIELTRAGLGTTVRNLTLSAGAGGGRTGYNPLGSIDIGSVSTDIVAQISGTTHRAAHIECQMFQGNRWGGALFINTIPSIPPFWTAFDRTVEVLGDGASPPGPGPDPDPDPDPDPSDGIAIVMLAGAHETMPGIGYFPGLEMGGVDSDTLQVGGQTGTLLFLVYDYDVNEIVMAVDNLNGITSIILRIEGGEAITLSLTPDHVWTAGLAETPFMDGQSYSLDLLIEAAEEPGEGDQYADFELGAGTLLAGGEEVVGFVVGEAGTLQPENPVIGGINGIVYTIAYDVGAGLLGVVVAGIFGASGATLTVGGAGDFVLDVEDSEHGFLGMLSMPGSPFVDGETYDVRLYLEGELRDTNDGSGPDPEPGDQYADVIVHAEDYGPPGLGYTGFRAEVPGELEGFGSATPLLLDIGGVVCTLVEINHSYSGNETFFALQDVYGVTGASMVVDGVAFSMEFGTFEQYVFAWADGAESPFVDGQSHNVRIHLEGDLRDTAEDPDPDPDPGDGYVDLQLTAGSWVNPGSPSTNTGYNMYAQSGEVGSVEPETISMAGIEFSLGGCSHYPDIEMVSMYIDDLWGATAGKLVIDGVEYILEIGEDEYGIHGDFQTTDSPFVVGETHSVRLYLEGELRDTP